jgi:hypothetical protein
MEATRRAEIQLEADAFERLEARAVREGVSVSELIRRTVYDTLLSTPERRRGAAARIAALDIPLADWDRLEEEILDARAGALPR